MSKSTNHEPSSHVHFNFSWAIIQDCPCGCTVNDPGSVLIEDELSDVMDTLRHECKIPVRTILDTLLTIQQKRAAVLHGESSGATQTLTVAMLMTELVEA